MHLRRTLLGSAALALTVCLLSALDQRAEGHLLIFKDGFTVQGRVKQEMTGFSDPNGGFFSIPATGKPYWVDDGVRNIYFSPNQLKEADDEAGKKVDLVKFARNGWTNRPPLPQKWEVDDVTPWDDNLERIVKMTVAGKQVECKQRITGLTPDSIKVESERYKWICYIQTKELSGATVKRIVEAQLARDLVKDPEGGTKAKDIEYRVKAYRFLLQANFLDEAADVLNRLVKDHPGQKSNADPLLENLKRLKALQVVDSLMLADKSKLHDEVRRLLGDYSKKELEKILDERTQLKVQAVKEKYATFEEKIKDSKRLLEGFPSIVPPAKVEYYKAAADAILAELNPDTVGRLETFLGQALDYERAVKDKRKPEQSAEEVLAFAMTGWLRGSNSAEKSPKVAQEQWEVRQLLLEYLRSDDATYRKGKLIPALKARGLTVDEAMQFLKFLPPPDAEKDPPLKPKKMQANGAGLVGVQYELQLPPGYHHQRAWPVLIALHHSEEQAAAALARWSALAAQHGYILAAPHWGKGIKTNYSYTAAEHATVLETLRDLRRRFQVDSDRVFLFGGEEGGSMAFDVGLSHPDQFAGVIPMSGMPKYFGIRYWPNGQYLPFYIVTGQNAMGVEAIKPMFKDWTRGHYPSILVEYKGRPGEWFSAEQATIFDWMNRKRRASPQKEVGRVGEEFRTHRTTDTQFYWISTNSVQTNHVNSAAKWNQEMHPATLGAGIYADNTVMIRTTGVGSVTLWFGPKMLDYKQNVQFKVNGSAPLARQVTPSLETLLETLTESGDRQRLYFARVDLKL
jgi:hypothetical protein